MFTFAGSSLSSRMHAITCAAKASFSSIRSIWSSVSPARLRTFWVAGIGPSPMQEGSTPARSEEHTSELQSLAYLVCRLLLEKKKKKKNTQSDSRARTCHQQ